MTSAIIKHKCVEQAYAISPWSEIKDKRDGRFEIIIEKENLNNTFIKLMNISLHALQRKIYT